MFERRVGGLAAKGLWLMAGALLIAVPLPSDAGQIGAYVELLACSGTTQDGGYGSFAAAVSSSGCGNSASGSAGLATGDLELSVVSAGPGYGASGYAWLQDSLTFADIPLGGFVDVTVTISGAWHGSFDWSQNADFQVQYDLLLGPLSASNNFSRGFGYANLAALTPSHGFTGDCGGAISNCPGPTTTGPYYGEVAGSYSFSRTWQVYYFGGAYPELDLFASLHAQASNGGYGFIDHPLVVTLSDPNVSFVSQSGNPYSVIPEPSTFVLVGTGLAALALRRGNARRTESRANNHSGNNS